MGRSLSITSMVAVALLTTWAAAAGPFSVQESSATQAHESSYRSFEELVSAMRELDAAHASCGVKEYGSSREGRPLLVLTLSSDVASAAKRPAMLITAGLDASHRVGMELALRIAGQLLESHADLLAESTVYIIPCANPDRLVREAAGPMMGVSGTLRPVDADRDGSMDEDGPVDLNGDGFITQMRRINPPLDDPATHLADPAEPRLMKKPDAAKGERATYTLYVEGRDQDGDGLIAEDGVGAVDLDRNFMHMWPEHRRDAGPTQLSEPESAALAQFVLEHPTIVIALTYGRHDTLVNTPDSKSKDITGETPVGIDGGDEGLYKEIAKRYKELVGQDQAPKNDSNGAFHAWLYAHRGIASFASTGWGRPKIDDKKPESKPDEQKPAEAATGEPGQATMGEGEPPSDGAASDGVATEEKGDKKKDEELKPADEEAAAWLKVFDADPASGGFVAWQAFEHPTLGSVEIGGFVPGFQMNPPATDLSDLGKKQADFAADLLRRRPQLSLIEPQVKRLGDGLYEVRLGLMNGGLMPTATSMARLARSIKPAVLRIDVPRERIIAGERVVRTWGIDAGAQFTAEWIVQVDDDATITVELINPQLGDRTIAIQARETTP